ncbi:MAG: hypothetical protein ABSB12_02500 [Candidatus Saccharimonadales bacterium]|jgi:hypothetical protein
MPSYHYLTQPHVAEIFEDCLYRDETGESQYNMVVGILKQTKFDPGKLAFHRQAIVDLLAGLPADFHQGRKHGANMRKATVNKFGFRWTDSIDDVDKLIQLGVAIGRVRCYKGRHFGPFKLTDLPNIVVN